ncbi:hypothetical protein KIK06_23625 [Nocardiopsis sp. EMB25]|uniref:hypothetical protein n=1 Tax=Nocardiopsis sp. EMB25 TaxID=2835867 RepID=UPI002284A535|nr:hypothetical protein [Nocardiopsis sp. EMB25]MCY9786877.1 hypothetical protein [Nocardiopsis sp. EMB25]
MKTRNSITRTLAVGVLAVGTALVGASTAASAGTDTVANRAAAACGLGAANPGQYGNLISGTGSRTECSGTVTLTVEVRKHRRAWPDSSVAETTRTNFSSGNLTAHGNCEGNGTYFTEIRSSTGNKLSSGRVNRC